MAEENNIRSDQCGKEMLLSTYHETTQTGCTLHIIYIHTYTCIAHIYTCSYVLSHTCYDTWKTNYILIDILLICVYIDPCYSGFPIYYVNGIGCG